MARAGGCRRDGAGRDGLTVDRRDGHDARARRAGDGDGRQVPARARRALVCVAATVVLVYAPLLVTTFAVVDDWSALIGSNPMAVALRARDGRPVYAVLFWLGMRLVPAEPEWMAVYRAATVVGLAGFAVLVARWLGRLDWRPCAAAAAAVAVVCLTPMQVIASWAATWVFPLGLCCGALAVPLAYGRGVQGWPGVGPVAAAVLLLVVGLCTYQPAAMVYFALLIPAVCRPIAVWPQVRGRVLVATTIGVMAVWAYVPVLILLQRTLGRTSEGRELGLGDPAAKARWFVETVLPRAGELWRADLEPTIGPVVGLVVAVAAALAIRNAIREELPAVTVLRNAVEQGGLVMALLCLSFASSLLSALYFPAYRTLMALSTGICLLFVSAGIALLSGAHRPSLRVAAAGALVVTAIGFASANTVGRYAMPHAVEWRVVKQLLRERRAEIALVRTIHVVRPGWNDGLTDRPLNDEFGVPSMLHPWVPESMAAAGLRAIGIDDSGVSITHSGPAEPVPPGDAVVLDLRRLRSLR